MSFIKYLNKYPKFKFHKFFVRDQIIDPHSDLEFPYQGHFTLNFWFYLWQKPTFKNVYISLKATWYIRYNWAWITTFGKKTLVNMALGKLFSQTFSTVISCQIFIQISSKTQRRRKNRTKIKSRTTSLQFKSTCDRGRKRKMFFNT